MRTVTRHVVAALGLAAALLVAAPAPIQAGTVPTGVTCPEQLADEQTLMTGHGVNPCYPRPKPTCGTGCGKCKPKPCPTLSPSPSTPPTSTPSPSPSTPPTGSPSPEPSPSDSPEPTPEPSTPATSAPPASPEPPVDGGGGNPDAPPALPVTGPGATLLGVFGALIVAAGIGFVYAARRRRAER